MEDSKSAYRLMNGVLIPQLLTANINLLPRRNSGPFKASNLDRPKISRYSSWNPPVRSCCEILGFLRPAESPLTHKLDNSQVPQNPF